MKTLKRIVITVLLLGFFASASAVLTGCASSKSHCRAMKVGNHR